MALSVDRASNINAAITNGIAFSSDGTNWDFISKDQVSTVTGWFQAAADMVEPNYPRTNKTILRIERSDDHAPLTFELQDVVNQATWTAGTEAALQIAKEDIASWI